MWQTACLGAIKQIIVNKNLHVLNAVAPTLSKSVKFVNFSGVQKPNQLVIKERAAPT